MESETDLARGLRLAARASERAMMRAAARAGLDMLRPSHLTVLRALDPASAGMRISALARDADVSRQAIQQVVADLERLGIVESTPDAEDRRARRVRYTTFGRRGYERCMTEFGRLEHRLEADIGASAMRRFKRDLMRLSAEADRFGLDQLGSRHRDVDAPGRS